MVKPVEEQDAIELLRVLADCLRWPGWFDSEEGEQYAKEVRPRLYKMAGQLEDLAALAKPTGRGQA
jgi:2-polyprenyl-6-methoxyphenol hydroxylase-like FAD-dependent oxidoreductase